MHLVRRVPRPAGRGADIDYDGISGPLDFDDNGNVTAASFMIYGFNDKGEYEILDYVESGGN